jgi:hypothetical protein
LSPSSGERALGIFERELSRNKQGARAFVETDQYLTRMARREHQARMRQSIALFALAAFPLATGIGSAFSSAHGEEEQHSRNMTTVLLFSEAAVILTLGTLVRLFETPTESALKLYREDPGLKVRFGGSVSNNAVHIGLNGTF